MTDSTSGTPGTARGMNLRVTFWGVQGSCPIFPTQAEVDQYAKQVAAYTVERTLQDIADQLERGQCTPQSLRALASQTAAAEYQQKFGLPILPIYGGDTTCIEVTTCEGNVLLFDLGTGVRDFSSRLTAGDENREGRALHVFASHEHLDHRNGLPFARFCFEKNNPYTVHLYGTRQVLTALDERYGIYSHQVTRATYVDDPLDYRVISANFTGTEIRTSSSPLPSGGFAWPIWQVGEPIHINATTITPFEVYHGITQCLAYKVQHGSSSFVFCTDHELRHGPDPSDPRQIRSIAAERRLLEYCQNVDVAYFDGQYFMDEYTGAAGIGTGVGVPRLDWGHSCIEDVIARVKQCNIRRTFIGHHDPERLWGQRIEIDRELDVICKGTPYEIHLAKAGATINL